MSRLLFICVVMCLFFSCKKKNKFVVRDITTVEIETILQDSLLNVRALELSDDAIFIGTSRGETMVKKFGSSSVETVFKRDSSSTTNFRAIAYNGVSVFTLSIASPALLFKDGELVYTESHEKAFYDSLDFWNEKEGIAIGDPTEDCLSIIITRDGGETWSKLSCGIVPKTKEGEAAFAASDTNIAIIGDQTWIATGGKASRILYSPDKGKTWEIFDTPIIQGVETTGIYSIDFYDALNGFGIGGDYTKSKANELNKIKTVDGGESWSIVAKGKAPGYRSCVQYLPNSNAKQLVAIGIEGIDYSNDSGDNWIHLSDEGFYTLRFLNDSIAYAGGNGRVVKLSFK